MPVIASGGANSAAHLVDALEAGADAVLAASIFHYKDTTVEDVRVCGIAGTLLPSPRAFEYVAEPCSPLWIDLGWGFFWLACSLYSISHIHSHHLLVSS